MRNTNKIVAATAMLLVSVLMLGTATYAWFAMNTRSVANGLTVEAYTESNFLEIKNDEANAKFGITTSFTENNTGLLRLVTPKFFNTSDMVTLTATAARGNYSDTSIDYYKLADSDKGGAQTTKAYNYVHSNHELELASSLVNLYANPVFEIVTSNEATTGTFYELIGNRYYVRTFNQAASAKGLYRVYYFNKYADGDTYVFGNEYYNLSNGIYTKVDTSNGFNIGQTDVSAYYYRTFAMPSPIASDGNEIPRYDGTGTYYSYDTEEGCFSKVGYLKVGSDLTNYYTLEVNNYDEVLHTDNVEYYLKNQLANGEYDYSYVGKNTESEVGNFLYWGRAYSSDPEAVQKNNTLNIINPNGINDDAVTNYYLHKTLYLRQAEGTNNASNLRIEDVRIGGAKNELSNALRVLFVAYSEHDPDTLVTYIYDHENDNENGNSAESKLLFNTLLGNEAETITVDIYVYFDGMDDDANNAQVAGAVLNGQSIEIEFAIDELDYNKVQ